MLDLDRIVIISELHCCMASPKTASQDVGVAMRYGCPPADFPDEPYNTSITFRRVIQTPIFRMKGRLLIVGLGHRSKEL